VRDVVHAAVAELPREELPEAIASSLGTVADDVLVERAIAVMLPAEREDVHTLISEFESAVLERHFG
jgi:hypothetical protein